MAYIASVRVQAQRYGACKIIPPTGWRPRGAAGVVPEDLSFVPRLMPLHTLQQGAPAIRTALLLPH